MFTHLQLNGYRGFKSYTLNDLARVNLLVGKNNCGKTSVLEAINLLTDNGSLRVLAKFASQRRQRYFWFSERPYRDVEVLDITPVFFGYRMEPGTELALLSNRSRLSMQMVPLAEVADDLYSDSDIQRVVRDTGETPSAGLKITASSLTDTVPIFPVTEGGSLIYSDRLRRYAQWGTVCRSRFLSSIPMYTGEIRNIWDKVIREGREASLIHALRTLEPDIESIHLLTGDWSTTDVLVGVQGDGPRIGIGSFGEGMRRLLDLALALIDSANGVLLIDEIDTGLHWTVMEELWRFVIGAARQSDIQVFATTHSYDCIEGLASLMQNDPGLAADVSLQKVERALSQAVALRGEQLPVAIEQDIEVR